LPIFIRRREVDNKQQQNPTKKKRKRKRKKKHKTTTAPLQPPGVNSQLSPHKKEQLNQLRLKDYTTTKGAAHLKLEL
jgi:hypothetical protein